MHQFSEYPVRLVYKSFSRSWVFFSSSGLCQRAESADLKLEPPGERGQALRQDLPSKRKACCPRDGSGSGRPAEALCKPSLPAGLNTQRCRADSRMLLQEESILICPPDSWNIKFNRSCKAPCLCSPRCGPAMKQKLDSFQHNLVHQVC